MGESAAEVLEGLAVAVGRAEELALSCQPSDDVLAWLCGLQGLRARIESLCCRAAVEAGSVSIPALEGQRTVAAVVAAHTGSDPKPVAGDQRLGSWLAGFPLIGDAFAAGRITRRHVEVLRRLDNARTRHHLVEAEGSLVEAAETCQWPEFEQVARYWSLGADPDGSAPDQQVESRYCRISKDADGSVVGRFRLDPIAGQAVLSAIQQEAQRLFRADTETSSLRTTGQRDADALGNVIARGATRPDGTIAAPLVHLVISEALVEKMLETPDRAPEVLDSFDIDGRCELVDGTPIHPRLALTTLAAATFRRQVLRSPSVTIDLGRRVRGFPPTLKQALLVAARGRCRIRGCDAPFPWLQADHIHPWHHEGATSLANGQILCDPHNKAKGDR